MVMAKTDKNICKSHFHLKYLFLLTQMAVWPVCDERVRIIFNVENSKGYTDEFIGRKIIYASEVHNYLWLSQGTRFS